MIVHRDLEIKLQKQKVKSIIYCLPFSLCHLPLTFCFLLFALCLLPFAFCSAQQAKIVVALDGSGNYKTVQEALNAVPINSKDTFTIFIKKGIYKERLVLDTRRNFVKLVGQERATTVLTFDNHARKKLANGDTINTWNSASFFIYGDDFTAENLTFENNAGFTAGQAVAIFANGTRLAFKNCTVRGFQDILFCSGSGSKQYYVNCRIEGTTDFIFGPATAVFNRCVIHSKKRSHITAPSTPREIPFGFVFLDCQLTADDTLTKVSLGRPWQPNGATAYIRCDMGKHILPEGWSNWNNPNNEKTARFSEYKSFGAGANSEMRVGWSKQLTDEEAKNYTVENILGTWKPN